MEQGSTLVSCLLPAVSSPGRLARAVLCYQQQSWKYKELVVIDGGDADLTPLLEDIPAGELQYIRVAADIHDDIAALKNIGMDMAKGVCIAHWGPEDWHHPMRIHHQMSHMQDNIKITWLSGTLLHIDHPELFHHPYADRPKDGYAGSLLHVNDPGQRYLSHPDHDDRAFLKQWDQAGARRLDMEYAWLIVRGMPGDRKNQRRFLAGLRGTAGDAARLLWLKFRGRDRLSHPRFRLSAQSHESFQKYLQESGKLGILTAIS
jgi:glycosyltransferase involved in cell wall biosynthesis